MPVHFMSALQWPFIRYRGNKICLDESLNKQTNERTNVASQTHVRWWTHNNKHYECNTQLLQHAHAT